MLPEQAISQKVSSRPRRVAGLVSGVLLLVFVIGVTFIGLKRSGVLPSSNGSTLSGTPTDATTLELHNNQDDCWVAIHGVVYDLTSYGPSHPGGSHWIWESCGTEATAEYDRNHKSTSFLSAVSNQQVGTYGGSSSSTSGSSSNGSSTSTPQSSARSTPSTDQEDDNED